MHTYRFRVRCTEHELEARAHELEALARRASTATVYTPTPADENPGWCVQMAVSAPATYARFRSRDAA